MGITYNPRIVTDGLVLALDAGNTKSYPGSGTTWTDLSGRGNTGTLTNGPTYNSSNGGSIVFDGSNDYVSCGSSIITSGSFTFSAWARSTTIPGVGSAQVIISQGSSAGGSFQYLAFRNNLIQFTTDASSSFASSDSTPIANVWYNIVGIYNSSITNKNTIYINTILQNTISTASANFGGNLTSLGRSPFGSGGGFLNGNIAQVSIYNRALTASEIRQNYNATKSRYQ